MRLYLLYLTARSLLLDALPFAWARRIRRRELWEDLAELREIAWELWEGRDA
jgi:hypothetical protein